MEIRRLNQGTLLLLLLVLALGGGVLVQWYGGDSQTEPAARAESAARKPPQWRELKPPAPVPRAVYTEISQRPLFEKERRPVEAPAPVRQVAGPALTNYVLEGTAISSDARVALVRNRANRKLYRAVIDEQIEGWTVKEVHEDAVVLERNGVRQRLEREDNSAIPNRRGAQSNYATRETEQGIIAVSLGQTKN